MCEDIILKKVVYFDEHYKGSWISEEESRIICDFFSKKEGFKILNALDLKTWLEYIINTKECENSTLIFAQDIVPDTVFPEVNTRVLIFRYLRMGGKIMWMGDIPFYYKGVPNTEIKNLPVIQYAGLNVILNVHQALPYYVSETDITLEGKQLGLKKDIFGSRPVQITYGLIPLTTSYDANNKKVANMWIKRGFIRLFDISREDDQLFDIKNHLNELYNIVNYPIQNLSRDIRGQRDIFIVHGHDEKSKEEIITLLEEYDLRPRFLNEYSTGSETLMDLLEKARECNYVIVILTPDDFGIDDITYKKMSEDLVNLSSNDWLKALCPRARQNVMFEFGFFRSILGKDRICVLLKENKAQQWNIPSDINGVYYVKFKESIFEKKDEIVKRLIHLEIII